MDADWLDIGVRLFVVLLLVGLNGFFVAAEFGLVSARRTRIEQMAAEGNVLARTVLRSMADPNRFISIAQVGISMASLALGFIGEPAVAALIEPVLEGWLPERAAFFSAHGISIAIAYVIITYLHLVLGEQVPKMIAIQRAEGTILVSAQLTEFVGVLLRPAIAVVYWSTEFILRLFGLKYQSESHMVYTVDELEMLVDASEVGGYLDARERDLINRALGFSEITASQIMVPRTEVVGIPVTATYEEVMAIAREAGRSRYPVYEDTLDQVVGVIHIKDLITSCSDDQPGEFSVRQYLRDVVPIPESLTVDQVLAQFKASRTHFAIVIDQFGGLAGIVTLEDVLEVLVGEIQDEFELPARGIEFGPDGSASVDGLVPIEEFNRQFGTHLASETVETMGGFVFEQLGRKPEVGDRVEAGGYSFTVTDLDGLRIARLQVTTTEAVEKPDG